MSRTHSSFSDIWDTSLKASSLHLGAMCDTNASLSIAGTPLVATSFMLSAMRPTNSSLNSSVSTPLVAALCLAPLQLVLYWYISLMAALFHLHLCSMCDTNSSSHCSIDTTLKNYIVYASPLHHVWNKLLYRSGLLFCTTLVVHRLCLKPCVTPSLSG